MNRLIPEPLYERIVAIRRELHQNPELSWQESETAKRVCRFLEEMGIHYRCGLAGYGIVAEIGQEQVEPRIAIRADMDALPVHEETGLEFASLADGKMHACGHDGHMAMVLGAAALLKENPPATPIRLIFQPGEESGQGAKRMIEAGALENVSLIFGGHVDRHYQTKQIAITAGTVNASTDEFEIQIAGEGGHAARPHESIDPVVVGSLLVMALQTIVSREVDPAHPSVVTVGEFHSGTAANVLASKAVLRGTIRAQEQSVRAHLQDSIRRIANSVGQLHSARLTVEIHEGTPAVTNSPEMAKLCRSAAESIVGSQQVVELRTANMGGEDFGFYLQHVPGCYVRFGSQKKGKEGYPAHSSRFDFDEQVLAVGAAYFNAIVRHACQSQEVSAA